MEKKIIQGLRNDSFVSTIRNILVNSNLKQKYIDILTDEYSLSIYDIAFTNKSADPVNNYEFYEIVGDAIFNKSIVIYITRRFPKFAKPEGLEILSRLTSKLRSKQILSQFAQSLDFGKYTTYAENYTRKIDMLEDVFEAFLGATENLMDTRVKFGTGYLITYNIIKSLFDKMKLNVTWEYLIDPITRLKEDYFQYREFKDRGIGTFEYKDETVKDERGTVYFVVKVIRKYDGNKIQILGQSKKVKKQIAKDYASEQAIETLIKIGFKRSHPEKFNILYDTP